MIKSLQKNNFYADDWFHSFFSSTNAGVSGWGHPQVYPAHTEIFRQDTPAVAVYFIENGLVKLSRIERSGQETIAALRRRHWMIGAPPVFLGKPYSFTNTTLTASTLRCISAEGFMNLVETDKDFTRQILAMLSKEIFSHAANSVNLACLPAIARLKQLLLDIITEIDQHSEEKREVKLQLPLKHKELAQIIAVTPEHLSRLLKALERDGVIQRDGNLMMVKDSRALM